MDTTNTGEIYPINVDQLANLSHEEISSIAIDYHKKFTRHALEALKYGMALGYILEQQKANLGARKYTPWLATTGIPRRSAFNYRFMWSHKERIMELATQGFSLRKIYGILNRGNDAQIGQKKQPALPTLKKYIKSDVSKANDNARKIARHTAKEKRITRKGKAQVLEWLERRRAKRQKEEEHDNAIMDNVNHALVVDDKK